MNNFYTKEDNLAEFDKAKPDSRVIAIRSYWFKHKLSPIPVIAGTHIPKGKWDAYQNNRPTSQEIMKLFPENFKGNIGLIAGMVSGTIVLDVDEKNGKSGHASLAKMGFDLPDTVTAKTPNGGKHYYFKYPSDIEISGFDLRDFGLEGVEVKGNGRKVEAYPSTLTLDDGSVGYYEWVLGRSLDDIPLAEMPEWLKKICRDKADQKKQTGFPTPSSFNPNQKTTDYGRAALSRECAKLVSATEGGRNNALNIAAVKLGNLIADGRLNEKEATDALYKAAITAGLGHEETLATIESGLQKGLESPRGPEKADEVSEGLTLISLADVKPKKVDWLWPGVLAKGMLSMIVGKPGLGKSQVSLWIAATVSKGGTWPASKETAESGMVLLLSGEDSLEHTIAPRLRACDANLNNIKAIPSTIGDDGKLFNLDADLTQLQTNINALKTVSLIVIDPASAYTGEADGNNNTDVRRILTKLAKFAETNKVSILLISHPSKALGLDSTMKVSGALAWAAAVRVLYEIDADSDDKTLRTMAPSKINIAKDNVTYKYTVIEKVVPSDDGEIVTSYIKWEDETETVTANQIQARKADGGKLGDAIAFLGDILKHCPIEKSELDALALAEGIAPATLRRGKDEWNRRNPDNRIETNKQPIADGKFVWGFEFHFAKYLSNFKPKETILLN